MRSVSVSELKSKMSELMRHVKRGERLVVTERGRPVAILAPAPPLGEPSLGELAELGLLVPGSGRLPRNFWTMDRPRDDSATVRSAVTEERDEGW